MRGDRRHERAKHVPIPLQDRRVRFYQARRERHHGQDPRLRRGRAESFAPRRERIVNSEGRGVPALRGLPTALVGAKSHRLQVLPLRGRRRWYFRYEIFQTEEGRKAVLHDQRSSTHPHVVAWQCSGAALPDRAIKQIGCKMETSQSVRSEKGWSLCRSLILLADQAFQQAMRDLPVMVRLRAPRLRCAGTQQAGTTADRRSRATRSKSQRSMRAQHQVVVPPQNQTQRNATATTTDASIDVLRHSSPDRIGPASFTRPTDCRLSRSGRVGGMPEASLDSTLHFMYRYCAKLAGTAHDELPKSDLQLLPPRGSSVSGLKLTSSENRPVPDGVVGRSRPLGGETPKKSRGFRSFMGSKALLSRLTDPVRPSPDPSR